MFYKYKNFGKNDLQLYFWYIVRPELEKKKYDTIIILQW